MSIKVLYFASLREAIGRSSDVIELTESQLVDPLTIAQLWQHVSGESAFSEAVLVSVNQEYRDESYVLSDDDEVAFFPPVTGG